MSRFDEIEIAIIELLHSLNPTVPISLYDVGVPLVGAGFGQEEIINVLFAMKEAGTIDFIDGNHLCITASFPAKPTPDR